jgi:hypothetical protein
MIQQLKIPPQIPDAIVDSTGTILYNRPASNVLYVDGTLVSEGLVVPTGGTLVETSTLINPYGLFDWYDYQKRDLELIGRDHAVAAAVVTVSSNAATIFGARVERPRQLGMTYPILPDSSVDRSITVNQYGTVSYVVPSSVPYDEVTADEDLYGRDLLLHETLARTSNIFVNPPVISVDTHGTAVGNISDVWSFADGSPANEGINPVLRLDVNLFSKPDKTLAFNDNSLGVYVANVENFLKNPFITAEQLIIQVVSSGATGLEAEWYSHDVSQDTANTRVWVAEPRLTGRYKIIYYTDTGLLRWYPPSANTIHIPQPQPFVNDSTVISGPGTDQIDFVVNTLAKQDSAFYAQKAGQLVLTEGQSKSSLLSGAYCAAIDQGGLVQNVQLTLTDTVRLQSIPVISAGDIYVGMTIIPQSYYEVLGCQLNGLTSTDDSGGLFPAAVSTTADYSFNLLPGNYQFEITYTNYGGDTPNDFPVLISFGGSIVSTSPLVFGAEGYQDGDVVTKTFNLLATGTNAQLSISWTGPAGSTSQLKVLDIRFVSSDVTPLSIKMNAALMNGNTEVGSALFECNGLRNRPDVAVFKFSPGATVSNPSILVNLVQNSNLPALSINQVQLGRSKNLALSQNIDGLGNYPWSMLNRAFNSIVDSFNAIVDYQDPRVAVSSTVYQWNRSSTQSWISQLETQETRFNLAFRPAGPLDVGNPAIIPNGLQYLTSGTLGLSDGSVLSLSEITSPQLLSATAWMLTQGFYVATDAFLGIGPETMPPNA